MAASRIIAALPLSDREREIVALLCQDLSDKSIADRLGLTAGTVKQYQKNIRRKLGCASRVGVALLAVGYSLFGVKTEN